MQWSNMSDSTYDRAFKELKDKNYLIQAPDKKNIYLFVEESRNYDERHKDDKDKFVISDKETIKKLFGSK